MHAVHSYDKNLKVCPTILAMLFYQKVVSCPKHDINVLTQQIEAYDIHFCMKIVKISYLVIEKITGN